MIISGGSSGIGYETAKHSSAQGDKVYNIDINPLPKQFNEKIVWVEADISQWHSVAHAVDEIYRMSGRIDVVIANAGISIRKPFHELTETDIRRTFQVNTMGVVSLWQAALKYMVNDGSGVLLATASTNASVGNPRYTDYNMSKAAVLALMRTVALEYAPSIRTACVSPGYVLTPMQRAEYSAEMLEAVNKKIPLNRHAAPAEIAQLYYFLVSENARYITGQQIVIDGGELAGGTASDYRIHQ